ncbi:MAG: hypothetical protein AAFY02_20250 [Pseudomonadota bacterium]
MALVATLFLTTQAAAGWVMPGAAAAQAHGDGPPCHETAHDHQMAEVEQSETQQGQQLGHHCDHAACCGCDLPSLLKPVVGYAVSTSLDGTQSDLSFTPLAHAPLLTPPR